LEHFAERHGLKIGTIADLIHYRLQNEKTIELLGESNLRTEYGVFRLTAYQDKVGGDIHLALAKGAIAADTPVLVRVHMLDTLSDLFGAARDDVSWPLREALRRIAAEPSGVLVVLRKPNEARDLAAHIRDHRLLELEQGVHLPKQTAGEELRTFGVGAQILADIGVGKMRVLGTPKRMHGLSGFGLEVVEYVGAE
jgi:3,4-dihydroxy 2-butanone 4-phosphate synthase/GTP cyclohydrolase II